MRRLVVPVVFLALSSAASADSHGLDASLDAKIDGRQSSVELHLTNHSDKTYCFFRYDRVVGYEASDGAEIVTAANDLDTFGAAPESVDIVWNDGVTYTYSLFTGMSETTFDTLVDARRASRADYWVAVYDCASLFRHRYGTAKPLFVQKVVTTPIHVPDN